MNNGNSSKQVLLSVLGIAVLVIAVVGVSFAFFTYSHTGDNQLLTTGSIFFQFLDGQEIVLTNQFPISDSAGETLNNVSGAKNVMTFSIVGYTTGDPIPFQIKAVSGDAPASIKVDGVNDMESRTPLEDDEIKILLTEKTSSSLTKNYTDKVGAVVKKVSEIQSGKGLTDGIVLADGSIKAKTKETQETDTFELRMWIANDVTFGEDETGSKGDNDYTNAEFAKKYYALKIQVVAGDAVTPVSQP